MKAKSPVTKILFIDNDEASFQIRQCVARVLAELPPLEMFHARDASEGLALLDEHHPDVVVFDDELGSELKLFLDSLAKNHPPIVFCTETADQFDKTRPEDDVTCIPKCESLEGLHQTLVVAASLASKAAEANHSRYVH